MAEKLTPNGLVVGWIPEESEALQEQPKEEKPEKKPRARKTAVKTEEEA